jgi:conjugative relaxase-like TrwC/TraI family protein
MAGHGEPPGIWTGRGCPELGLRIGSQVDGPVMERLYGAFVDPRDPSGTARLGRAPSGFAGNDDKLAERIAGLLAAEPAATPERRNQIIMQALKDQRAAVYFFDATFSVPKSVSLLHAAYQVRAQQAEQAGRPDEAAQWQGRAQVVWDAIMAGNQAMLDYLQREAGYSRAGYHAKGSGRFVDAHDWVIASFRQHTSRDHDPQLHVHNAILNRVLRVDPLASRPGDRSAWRTLDGAALYAARPAAGAIAERALAEHLTRHLGVTTVARPDGNGWEIAGISEETRALFSSRRRAIEPRVHQLIEEYQARHGRAPDARAVWSMAQFVTLDSRRAKEHSAPSRDSLLAQWEDQTRRAETSALSAIPEAVSGGAAAGDTKWWPPSTEQLEWVVAAAVADAQRAKPTFTRYELTRMINRYLPDYLGGLGGQQVMGLLEELTTWALGETVLLTAPDMVPVPDMYRRADGLSLWHRHGAEVYTTRAQLNTETRLLRAAAQNGAPRIAPEAAAAALGVDRARVEAALWCDHGYPGAPDPGGAGEGPLSSAGLADDQVQAGYGVLVSGRAIDILIGPAGTGKTRTVAQIAAAWQGVRAGRVIGLATSTSAALALAGEGLTDSYSLADFLGRLQGSDRTRGYLPVHPGDLLIVDEASMVSTADLAAVEEIATRTGAKILLTGDTEQLSAPEAAGALKLLAGEHGYYQLSSVQRFEEEWERAASVRLRDGDCEVLAEYDQRGRILEGTREEMAGTAQRRWLADHLRGKASLLLAPTNVQAVELARRARDELAELGLVAVNDLAELADGNVAGVGDLVLARQNARIEAGEPGRRLANRDVLRIESWDEIGEERVAVVRRVIGGGQGGQVQWSAPFELPEQYVAQHLSLAYAGNIHVAQSRTVDTAHVVIDETAGRPSLYVGMSRGRERNTAYLVTERAHAADLAAQPRPAPDLADPGTAAAAPPARHRLAVLTEVLQRTHAQPTATETVRQELERAASLATLAPVWADVTRAHATRRYEGIIRSLLGAEYWQRYEQDPERGTLARLLLAAELGGHDVAAVLRRAVGERNFKRARSMAAILHGRVTRIVGVPDGAAAGSHADRMPLIEDPEAARFARELAAAMDERMTLLGERAALDQPLWAVGPLGEVPADPVSRADWVRRAGVVAAWREESGFADPVEAIGAAPQPGSPERRASWNAAYAALGRADEQREMAAACDGELWARRAAWERDLGWAPPYVAAELREAHLAEDHYRAEAVLAWHRADATADRGERTRAVREAHEHSSLAQEVGAFREALTEITEARRRWYAATEPDRQRAISADAELRRRHPEAAIVPLQLTEDTETSAMPAARPGGQRSAGQPVTGQSAAMDQGPATWKAASLRDLAAAVEAARRAEAILAARQIEADDEYQAESDDLVHRRETEAQVRVTAVRQDPVPGRFALSLDPAEPELEAGL